MEKTVEKKWYEDDRFWETFGPVMFNNERLDNTAEEVNNIIKLLGIEPSTKILDLCCGIGRHSLELSRRGYKVTGVDRTESYLQKARKQAQNENLCAEFVRADMRQFCLFDQFDTVINMFTAFGYFENPCDDKRVLLNIYSSLRKNGNLIIDLAGKEVIARIWQEREWRWQNDAIFLRQSKISQNWSWCENKWMMLENGKIQEFNFGHRIYSAVELSGLLKDCGFSCIKTYGDLDGSDYDQNAKRLVLVAEK